MITLKAIDYFIKNFISLFYRIIIILYGISIVLFQNSYFHISIYSVVIIFYFLFYLYALKKQYSLCRLFNDYFFIGFILFDKNIETFYNIVFIMLPILNSPNHTEEKRNPLLLLLFTAIVLLFTKSFNDTLEYNALPYYIIPFTILGIIISFEKFRTKLSNYVYDIYSSLDDIHYESTNISQISKTYKQLINAFNNIKFLSPELESITGFELVQKKLILLNSSDFIISSSLGTKDIEKLYKNEISHNLQITLNQKIKKYNTALKLEMKDRKFVFFIFYTKDNSNNILLFLFLKDLYKSVMVRIVKSIIFDQEMSLERFNRLKKIKSRLDFVNDATKTMHFLKNKITPLKTFLRAFGEYEIAITAQNINLQSKIHPILVSSKKTAEDALKLIIDHSTYLLDKTRNPNFVKTMKKIKLKHLIMIINEQWRNVFGAVCNIDDNNINDIESLLLVSDREIFTMLIVDILENMNKYSAGGNQLLLKIDDNLISFHFINNIQASRKDIESLKNDIKNFNNNNKNEINKRSSFGLMHIRDFCETLSILVKLNIIEDNSSKRFVVILKLEGEKINE